ncbi:hypothetical protein [Thalassoglobus neptunius]|uniref:hypothetical protein n=1 Tax=Thalassoglobus neptunius TaxID=1938619 RepID=UPI001E345B14|nr:hypothetical protein [Thalassoglobus neptunius]
MGSVKTTCKWEDARGVMLGPHRIASIRASRLSDSTEDQPPKPWASRGPIVSTTDTPVLMSLPSAPRLGAIFGIASFNNRMLETRA